MICPLVRKKSGVAPMLVPQLCVGGNCPIISLWDKGKQTKIFTYVLS